MLAKAAAWGAARYISHQRDRWGSAGLPLTAERYVWLSRHFDAADLDRLRLLEGARLPIPALPAVLRKFAGWDIPSPGGVAAITFDHLVMARYALSPAVLFHEMVHVVQFRMLGVKKFSEEYVGGFLKTRSYENIPLEQCAYDLETRFMLGERKIDIEAEIERYLNRRA